MQEIQVPVLFQTKTMDFDKLASSDFMDKLKCTSCSNYLSYFPIYSSSNNQNICGRCSPPEANGYVQNEIYQVISQFMQFPCRYKSQGCFEEVHPKEMPQHEENCRFRIMKCPTVNFTQCDWEESGPNLMQHCQDKHADMILKDGMFELDLSHSLHNQYFLEHEMKLFVVMQKFDSVSKLVEYSICNIDCEANNYSCEISFKNGNRKVSIQCHTSAYDEPTVIRMFLHSLVDLDKAQSDVFGKISLAKGIQLSFIDEEANMELLSRFRCSSCKDYVIPPIYLSKDQLNIQKLVCSECSQKISDTYSSNTIIESIDMLDDIAGLLKYPCKNQKSGCSFILVPIQMKNHQLFCLYGNYDCPVNEYVDCKWNGCGKNIMAHIQENHHKMIVNSSEIFKIRLNFNNSIGSVRPKPFYGCYIIKFSNRLFRLVYSKNDRRCLWTAQIIGDCQENYKYDLEIIDGNKQSRRLMLTQLLCSPLTKKNLLFIDSSKYCYFRVDQIREFLSGSEIQFKVRIFK